jgi:hypothetical protein
MFQATRADKEDTRKMVHTINRSLDATIAKELVDKIFDRMWPDLEEKLSALPSTASGATPPKRSVEDMLAELLELNRDTAFQVQSLIRDAEAERRVRDFRDKWSQQFTGKMGGKLSDLLDADKLDYLERNLIQSALKDAHSKKKPKL